MIKLKRNMKNKSKLMRRLLSVSQIALRIYKSIRLDWLSIPLN